MPERVNRLRSALEELEHELTTLDSVDEATREALQAARDEIQGILERAAPGADESDKTDEADREPSVVESSGEPREEAHGGLVDQLKAAEQQFEASHPTISNILMRIVDALGQMGI